MILYIAEKPSVARAVADVLPKPHQKGDGFIRVANGDIVTWCIGHLLEQAEPEAYDPEYKQWKRVHLPIIPTEWKQQVKPKTCKAARYLSHKCTIFRKYDFTTFVSIVLHSDHKFSLPVIGSL